jgi:hypothetical protein
MTTFQTKDIDLATYASTVCGPLPEVFRDTYDGQAIFEFELRPELQAAIVAFSTDTLARRLLATRRRLFHETRRVTGGVK